LILLDQTGRKTGWFCFASVNIDRSIVCCKYLNCQDNYHMLDWCFKYANDIFFTFKKGKIEKNFAMWICNDGCVLIIKLIVLISLSQFDGFIHIEMYSVSELSVLFFILLEIFTEPILDERLKLQVVSISLGSLTCWYVIDWLVIVGLWT